MGCYVNFSKELGIALGPQLLSGDQVWPLITGCHLCEDLTPGSDDAEELGLYDPDSSTECNTLL